MQVDFIKKKKGQPTKSGGEIVTDLSIFEKLVLLLYL